MSSGSKAGADNKNTAKKSMRMLPFKRSANPTPVTSAGWGMNSLI